MGGYIIYWSDSNRSKIIFRSGWNPVHYVKNIFQFNEAEISLCLSTIPYGREAAHFLILNTSIS
jgi:hypothetical protein